MTKKLLMTCAALFAVIIAVFMSSEFVFADEIIPGVSIANQNFAGQNPAVIKQKLIARLDQYIKNGLILKTTDAKYKLNLEDAGVNFNYDAAVNAAIEYSHGGYFGVGAWRTFEGMWKNRDIVVPVTIDQAKLKAITDTEIHKEFTLSPVDATLNITDSVVEILPDKNGLWIDEELLWSGITNVVSHGETQMVVPMIVKSADVKPDQLGQAKTDAERILAQKITLTSSTKKIIPERSDIKSWIIVKTDSDQVRAGVDIEKIKSYLATKVAPLVEQKSVNQVNNIDGTQIQAGKNGIKLTIESSASSIAEAINAGTENPTVKLTTEIKNMSVSTFDAQAGGTPGLAEGKYIEVSLSRQRMYLYEGSTFVNSFGVSTGKWSTPTPVGTFAIHSKADVAHSAAYDLYMPYWNAITADGQYGIHGLPYKGSWIEGANHIGTPVSHGCIRLGPGNDSFVYNWAPIGTQVFIHQ